MPPKKSDPFNFDDLYIAAGAEGLVKKSMSELRKGPTPTGAALGSSSVSASKPVATQPFSAQRPTSHNGPAAKTSTVTLPSGALDFLEGLGTATSSSTAAAPKKPVGQVSVSKDFFQDFASPAGTTAPKPTTTSTADPFAMFEDVPGLQPTVEPAAPLPASITTSSTPPLTDAFPGFEDIPAFPAPPSSQPAPPQPQPSLPASHSWDDIPAATQPHYSTSQPVSTTAYSAIPSSSHANVPAQPGAARPGPEATTNDLRHTGSYWSSQATTTPFTDTAPTRSSNSGTGQHARPPPAPTEPEHTPLPSRFSDTSSNNAGDLKPRNSGSGGGVVGMLRGFGKKAVRAAQAGLQHIESALEKMDQGPLSQQPPTQQAPSATGQHRQPQSTNQHQQYGEPLHSHHAVSDDDPASLALTLLALPQDERPAALASLPAPLRHQVDRMMAELMSGATASPPLRHSSPAAPHPHPASAQEPLIVDIRTNAVDLTAWDSHDSRSSSSSNLTQAAQPVRTARPATSARPGAQGPPSGGYEPVHSQPPTAATAPSQPPAPAPPTAPPTMQQQPLHDSDHDLLGMSDGPKKPPAPAPAPARAPVPSAAPHVIQTVAVDDHDLLGVASPAPAPSATAAAPAPSPPQPPAPAQPKPAVVDVDDMHDFFSGGGPAPAAAAAPTASRPAAAAAGSGRQTAAAAAAAPMMDLGSAWDEVDVDISAHAHLYENNEGEEGEPELRKRLRAARLAEKHAKMQGALASKLAADEEEARTREEQVALKEQHKALVEQWKNKSKGNIRGLLGSLQMVLWEGSGWKPIGMGDLLEPAQIRKAWMKANLLVHPDKVRQRSGSPEQVARADMIFDVIKDAWNLFQTGGK